MFITACKSEHIGITGSKLRQIHVSNRPRSRRLIPCAAAHPAIYVNVNFRPFERTELMRKPGRLRRFTFSCLLTTPAYMSGPVGGINSILHPERSGRSLCEGSSICPADAFTAKGLRGKVTLLCKGGVMEGGKKSKSP